jgi:hypothetical protein
VESVMGGPRGVRAAPLSRIRRAPHRSPCEQRSPLQAGRRCEPDPGASPV